MWKTEEVPKVYLMALCGWREARNCSVEAIRGVLHVIKNRVKEPSWWGSDYVEVILKPKQFSSFNLNDINSSKFPSHDDRVFNQILDLTDKILNNEDEDNVDGATHYHDSTILPEWSRNAKAVAKILPFIFYKFEKESKV